MTRPQDFQSGYSIPNVLDTLSSPKDKPMAISGFKGINTQSEPTEIEITETAYCLNARIRRGFIEPRGGLTLVKSGFDSTVMLAKDFPLSTGSKYYVVVTILSLYVSSDMVTFTRVPYIYDTGTASADGSKVITGSAGTLWKTKPNTLDTRYNVNPGDKFQIGAGAIGTIDTVDSDTQITLLANYATASGAYTIDRYFGGDNQKAFWGLVSADFDYFIFSNGVDPVMYIDAAANGVARLSDDCPPAKYGLLYADRLIIGNLPELNFRIMWCIRGSFSDWIGTGSGFKDWVETPYEINGLSILNNTGVVYKKKSICFFTQTGDTESPFAYSVPVPDVGCYFGGGVLTIFGTIDMFPAENNFYLYDGNTLSPIGDKIKDNFYNDISAGSIGMRHGFVLKEFTEIQFFYPSQGNTTPNKVIVYNQDMNIWESYWDIPATASGFVLYQISEIWSSASGTWSADTGTWDEGGLLSPNPVILIGQGTSLFKEDQTALDDNGIPYTFEWHTKQIKADEDKLMHITGVVVDYFCTDTADLKSSISGDGGSTWSTEQTVSLSPTNQGSSKKAFFDFLGDYQTIIIKLKSTSGCLFQIVKVSLRTVPVGDVLK